MTDDLDAAWESVPSAPSVTALDPIEQLLRTFRGAIAANPALWRNCDLEGATALLADLARKRPSSTTVIPLEPVLARMVKAHVPRTPLAESLLAFQKEAKEAGHVVALPRAVADLGPRKHQELLKSYYARLARGGNGANARTEALAGTLILFSLPPRTERLAQVLGACVLVGGLFVALDPAGRPPGPRRLNLALPDDALPCTVVETHGQVLRCTLEQDTLRRLPVEEERARRSRTRVFAKDQGLQDLLVLDAGGLPLSPR